MSAGPPLRPRLHLTPRRGWINDPLGLTWHRGAYHLFTQHVPDRTAWALDCRWGHATSPDLLHWTERPVALEPGDGDDGCWSGCVVRPADGSAVLLYTSASARSMQIGRIRTATPVDASWDGWTKGGVVAEVPPEVDVVGFRDPYVLRDGDRWRMLVGAGLRGGVGAVLAYGSDDLERWTYEGVLASRPASEDAGVPTGTVWECPQLFPLGDPPDRRWVLTVAAWEDDEPRHQAAAVGTYADGRFVAERWHRMAHGPSPYAGSTFLDRDGRRGFVYWLRGVEPPGAAWAGATSLPHVLGLGGDGRVVAAPHPNLAALRAGSAVLVAGAPPYDVPPLLDVEWETGEARRPASLALESGDGRPVLRLDVAGDELQATTSSGSWTVPSPGPDVRVVLDGPVAEVFTAGGPLPLPVRAAPDLRLSASGDGRAVVHELAVGGP